ncbi:MAG: choice-of-anchor B family protein [Gemmatimonadota bacterium]|nr:choice-of-anchor B family protein [Gemmatimonadota bacterium]
MRNPRPETTRRGHPSPAGAARATAPVLVAFACLFASRPAPASAQAFGAAVLVADGRILAGEAAHEREPGTVRAYAYNGEWAQVATLRAPEPAPRDGFGSALASSGEFLFVGADRTGAGRVYVYRLSDIGSGEARPVQTLEHPELAAFGGALAASDGALVAAAREEDGRVLAAFRLGPDGRWTATGTLALPSSAGGRAAGWLALGGNVLAVADRSLGVVHVFERGAGGTEWALAAQLTHPDSAAARFAVFPSAVVVAGEEILVGQLSLGGFVRDAPPQREVVHRFAKAEGTWTAAGTLSPADGEGEANPDATGYGGSLAWDGTTLLVGGGPEPLSYRLQDGDWVISGARGPSSALAEEEDGTALAPNATLAFGGGVAAFGNPSADFGTGAVTVLSNESGEWVRTAVLTAEHAPLPAVTGGEVACADGEAAGYDCDRVDLLSFLPREELGAARGARLNDVWGWTDPETGREYGLVGRMDGTAFVDVTDPYSPRYLGSLAGTRGSRANTWRDIKVFNDHAFVVADGAGAHGMQVFDLTQLRTVTEPREFSETALYTDIGSVHNVAINEETGFAYLVGSSSGGETCGGGAHIVDVNDPLNPVFAGCFAHPNTGRRNTGYSHDAQCVIYRGPDEDYRGREICVNSNETALSVADVTDKDNPVAVARADYPNVAYAHQGWLTEDHRYFYSNDELDELQGLVESTRTLIWDLEDLDDPILLREYFSPTGVTDHNLYVRGDRLYMSNNRAGLRVLDIGDPENPVELGYFDTTPWGADESGFDGTWSVYPYFASGTILLSSRREGLFMVRPRARSLIP